MAEQRERFEEKKDELKVTDPKPSSVPTPESEKSLGKSMLMKVALATLLVAALIISIANVMRVNQLRAQMEDYRAQIDEYEEKISRLKYYINREVDDEYIIDFAREYLDMYFPDEDIYYNDVNE